MQVEASNTLSATPGTEHTLATPTGAKARVLVVDANALVAGETMELRFKGAVLSGGTERLMRLAPFPGALAEPNVQSPACVMPQGGTITFTQVGGTGRSIPWSVLSYDVQVESSNTLSATPGTEHTLATPTTAKTRVLVVDISALAAGQTVELRAKGAVLSGGTERLIQMLPCPGAQPELGIQTDPFAMPQGGTITCKLVGGSGQSIPWSICVLD